MVKILVIEDDSDLRNNLLEMLELEAFDVIGAENGAIGINKALSNLPDFIISDIMMPDMDGYQVFHHLKNNEATSTIPFIFLTAKSSQEELRQGMQMGVADYLTKPYSHEELLQVINLRLNMQSHMESIYNQAADDLRKNLTQALPHELRTPLAPIVNIAQIMQAHPDKISTDEIAEFGNLIYSGAERLSQLIEKYISFAELELIAKAPDKLSYIRSESTHHTDEAIQEALMLYFTAHEQQKVNFDATIDPAHTQMSTKYLKMVVHELIDNACKFSEENMPIRLRGQVVEDYYQIVLRDQGRGMKPEQIKQIQAYRQFDREKYEQQGMGLGLAIVQRIVELHQGEMTIKSKTGQGTLIKILIPLA